MDTTTTRFSALSCLLLCAGARGLVMPPPRSAVAYEATPAAQPLPERFNNYECLNAEGCDVGDDDDAPASSLPAAETTLTATTTADVDARIAALWATAPDKQEAATRDAADDTTDDDSDDDPFGAKGVSFAELLQSDDERDVWRRLELATLAGTPKERPSHELVDVDDDGVPKFLGETDFVFVDEPNCHGCSMCSSLAPATFFAEPLYGKGRAYRQAGDAAEAIDEATEACPRRAIKRVSFDDLKAFEAARDSGARALPPRAPVDSERLAREARARAYALAVARRAAFADRLTVDL